MNQRNAPKSGLCKAGKLTLIPQLKTMFSLTVCANSHRGVAIDQIQRSGWQLEVVVFITLKRIWARSVFQILFEISLGKLKFTDFP